MDVFRTPLQSIEREIAVDPFNPDTESYAKHVLLFEQDPFTRSIFADCLGDDFLLHACSTSDEVASEILARKDRAIGFDILVWSLGNNVEGDLRALREVRELQPHLKVVLLASQEGLAFAKAIRDADAQSTILKPLRSQDVRFALEKALKVESILKEKQAVHELKVERTPSLERFPGADLGLIGDSAEMRKVASLIRKVGPSTVSVLITGESGTGKEMVAQAIHRVSDR
ncbi:MAG TPA: sigma 54-interacting transcriptional regulator, partial [Bdellovibrionales bacterium]|nr:sigma 54-interacting transcriptional regulator [Bdellovibrionales bacterium]